MDLLLKTFDKFLYILEIFILIRVIISWFPVSRDNPLVELVYTLSEPILSPIRRLIKHSIFGGKGQIFDISPLIAFLVLQYLQNLIV